MPARALPVQPRHLPRLPNLGKGAQPEWLGKKLLAAAGIRVPDGDLARTADEAAAVATRIGYPVVLKAQAAALSHKTEAGGVALNLAEEAALRAAWDVMMRSVKRAAPDISIEGALVEKMSPKGVELMVGAKRDPGWGTVLLLGLGGIWVEALGDVQLVPGSADEAQILEALGNLRSAKLLAGVRGAPPVDVDAVVHVVMAIGRLMQTVPEIDRDRCQPADGACQGTRSDCTGCLDCHRLMVERCSNPRLFPIAKVWGAPGISASHP